VNIVHVCCDVQLALAGESHASLPEEEYWEAVWPNTPIPSSLRELLKPGPQGCYLILISIFEKTFKNLVPI